MCLEIPALVVAVDPDGLAATVSADHRTGRALLVALDGDAEPVRPGDWLLVHSGLAVERLDPDEAGQMLDLVVRARAEGRD
ncbi:MAG TPA: HypC/HybG/HupF family hydrogenase formation chaperone [Acidimicrobiales bacterium]|nr:HypC/HybG/HupF family hydrogenase formation chaperone [Acidimicrobiales bacterium]